MKYPPRVKAKAIDETGAQFAWDSTSIKAAMKCPRYYAFSILWGLQPKQKSVHLEFGGLFATALENFYKLRAEGATIDDATLAVVKEAAFVTWDEEDNQPVNWGDPKKTRGSLIRTIVWYIEKYAEEEQAAVKTHHMRDGSPCVEVSFRFQITDDIILCGHFDRIVNFNGDLWVMDQKTTGTTLSQYFFSNFKPDTQFTLYALAGKVILEEPVRGVIIDAAQIAVGFSEFMRAPSTRTQEEIDDWWAGAEHTIAVLQHLSRGAESPDQFPMNTESCGNYGGCAFKEVCSASPRVRPNIIKTAFSQRVWDPLVPR